MSTQAEPIDNSIASAVPMAHAIPLDDSTRSLSAVPVVVAPVDPGENPQNYHDSRHPGPAATARSSSRFALPQDYHGDESHLPTTQAPPPPLSVLSDETLRELQNQGYTNGLATALSRKTVAFPLTVWVVDNSGSMSTRDGHRIAVGGKDRSQSAITVVPSTRWSEMQQTVEYHAQLSALIRSPTVFRLLNDPGRVVGPQQFSVGEAAGALPHLDQDPGLAVALSTIRNASPGGVTPLVGHVREIRQNVVALESQLRREGTKVAIILATDGIPTDNVGNSNKTVKGEFVEALRSLEGLPVWVVVRLCTDDPDVVEFWNGLDGQLELSLEVLDDFCSEAQEIYAHNKWLNYALPLHRCREMGFHHQLFDLLDERSLAKDELRDFFRILFGDGAMDGAPDPEAEWDVFVKRVAELTAAEKPQWNPVSKRAEPWVNVKQLKATYGSRSWFSFR